MGLEAVHGRVVRIRDIEWTWKDSSLAKTNKSVQQKAGIGYLFGAEGGT